MDLTDRWGLHSTLSHSEANGPGNRFVVWVQGCALGCAGCFNPETHPEDAPLVAVEDTAAAVLSTAGIQGVTVTGGEPLQQPMALRRFCEIIREKSDLSIVVLTGFSQREVRMDSQKLLVAQQCDVLVCGRYNEALRIAKGLRGSGNKSYWFVTDRYSEADFEGVPAAEVFIHPDGTITRTGVDPIMLGELV